MDLSEISKKLKEDNVIKDKLSKQIRELIKGVDRVCVIPELLADIYEELEHEDESTNFDNQIMYWGLERYVGRKVTMVIDKLPALYQYCVDSEFTINNKFEWGGGDREVCYIPTNDEKKVLYFTNQNINLVCVLDGDYIKKLHIRQVYDDIFENEDYGFYNLGSFKNLNELREGLKQSNGLEIALLNLNSKYRPWSDCIEGNKYPDKISLKNMIDNNFDKNCAAFRYGDCRDAGYVLSSSFMDRVEVSDYHKAKYAFSDIVGAIQEVPNEYFIALKRDEKLDDILK